MTKKELEHLVSQLQEQNRQKDAKIASLMRRQSVFIPLWDWCKPYMFPMACCLFMFALGVVTVNYFSVQKFSNTVPATDIIMSEPEARLTFSAMEMVEADIDNNAFPNTEAATNALRANIPKNVREPVVEDVKSHSDGTVQQLPAAMEQTRKRIMIRR